VRGLVPFKETGFIDEVLYQKIFAIPREAGEVLDFVQRPYGGAEDVKDNESELSLFGLIEKLDIAQGAQRRRQLPGAHVNEGDV
jgi:hypothetical protein